MKPTKPLTIQEVRKKSKALKQIEIPDFIIDSVNELLVENYKYKEEDGCIHITQEDLVDRIKSKKSQLTETSILHKNYLNFENIFEKAGWEITYVNYHAYVPTYFEFKLKKK
jgi:hypothetical protein